MSSVSQRSFLAVCALSGLLGVSASAQTPSRPQVLVRSLETVALRDRADVRRFVLKHAQSPRGVLGAVSFELVRVERGRPIFLATHNVAAALSARIPEVRAGGWVGVDLHGDGIDVGIWDAGTALPTHVEFGGRVRVLDTVFPPATHATHVSGTVAARGVRDAAAGMANLVHLQARDWQNDEVEMAEASAQGLRLSNHSYGTFGGWVRDLRGTGRWTWMGDPSVSRTEDFRFGRYDEQSADWDAIAFQAPDYVIVKSAGNDRGEGPTESGAPYDLFQGGWTISTIPRNRDGGLDGYDTILDSGLAKNVITVGAVEDLRGDYTGPSDVVMSSFSAWGPADDGRIKPDLVATGTSVYSTVSGWNEAYAYSSGTSMAAPVVTGVVALVQEAFLSLTNGHPNSATIRALLIHSADEAGTTLGPDYRFGWGLVNAARAVALVQDEALSAGRILTGQLQPGETTEYVLRVTPGSSLEATLAWIDPPGNPVDPVVDSRSPSLVNDLDLRVDGIGGPWLPFVLNPEAPQDAARRLVNTIDNVERVYVPGATAGEYVVSVSLSIDAPTVQGYSLILGPARSATPTTASLSGTLTLAGLPLAATMVTAGQISVMSAADGSFIFPSLPSGEIMVVPDPRIRFEPEHAILRIPGDSFVSFEARSDVSISSLQLFSSPRLLRPDESASIIEVPTTAAGGTYGLNVFINTNGFTDLSGGQLVADFSASPFTASYAGDQARVLRQSSSVWKIAPVGDSRFWKRFPLIWHAPLSEGEVRIPTQVFDSGGRLVGVDTLAWVVDRQDDVPPITFHRIDVAGRGFAPPGQHLIIRADVLDGSALSSVSAVLRERGSDRVIATVPLHDDGAWSAHADLLAGDRLFSTVFTPRTAADYAVDLAAIDEAGNESVLEDAWHFSSRSFRKESDFLLVTWSQNETSTDASRLALLEIGAAHDSWEFDVRGQIPDSVLTSYDGIVWLWNDRGILRQEDRTQIESLIAGQVPLAIVGSQITGGDWLDLLTGFRAGAPVIGTGAAGAAGTLGADSVWQSVEFRLTEPAQLTTWDLPDGARPLLLVDGGVVTAASASLVVSSLSPTRVPASARGQYLRGLLASATATSVGEPTDVEGKQLPPRIFMDPPYPNPASHIAHVGVSQAVSGQVRIEVFDLLGRRVARVLDGQFPAGRRSLTVDVSQFASGLYLVVLSADGRTAQEVLVVTH